MFILLGTTKHNTVQAFGTKTGKPFQSDASVERAKKKFEELYPHLDFLVLPVTPHDLEAA